jgi:cephalosporin hydroxylase
MLEKLILRPLRKLGQIPKLSPEEIEAYATGPINKLISKFHAKRLTDLKKYETESTAFSEGILGCSPERQREIDAEFERLVPEMSGFLARASTSDVQLVRLLYFILRYQQPARVVETGVWHGVSTFFLLSALKANGGGRLASVDLPPMDPRTRVEVGGAVPERLRDSWNLFKGPAKTNLPRAFERLGGCDFFVHDGEHTYPNMMFEFREAWKHLAVGGLIVVDDADWNDSVLDFRDETGCEIWAIPRQKGGYIVVLRKSR